MVSWMIVGLARKINIQNIVVAGDWESKATSVRCALVSSTKDATTGWLQSVQALKMVHKKSREKM
jgi:hypothetical protein